MRNWNKLLLLLQLIILILIAMLYTEMATAGQLSISWQILAGSN